jgi:hypothetical protein
MTALKVAGITSALAAATGIRFEWAVPRIIRFYIGDHVLCLIMSPQAIPAILFAIKISKIRPTCTGPLYSFCSRRKQDHVFCIDDRKLSGRSELIRDAEVLSQPGCKAPLVSDRNAPY